VIVLVAVALTGGLLTDHFVFAGGTYEVPRTDGVQASGASFANMAEQLPAWHYPFLAVLVVVLVLGLMQRARVFKPSGST